MTGVLYLLGSAVLAVYGLVVAAAARSLVQLADRVDARLVARDLQRGGVEQ